MSGAAKGATGAGQEPAGAQPETGTAAAGQEPAAGTGQDPAAGAGAAAESESPEDRIARLERENKELRGENATRRRAQTELERQQAEAAQAGMTELEREQARAKAAEEKAAALEARVRTQAARTATTAAASKLNFRNVDLAYDLIAARLEYDGEGEPTNAEKLLKELAASDPYLVKPASGGDYGGGARGDTPPAQPGMNELIKAAVRGR